MEPVSRRTRQPSTLELLLGNRSSDSGVTELVGVALLWLGGSVVLLRKSSLFAVLFTSQRSGSQWLSAALRYPFLVLLHCLSISVTGCLQRRVATKWRQNITRKLHRFYFQKQNFYRLQSESKEHVITDADLRICRDVHEMAHATSEVAVSLIEALIKTWVFSGFTVLQKKWLGGFLPPAVFLLAVKIVLGTHPEDAKNVQASLQHFEGRLKQHFSRLQSRSESILMMQGEAFELDLLQKTLRDLSTIARKLFDLMFPLEMTEWMFLHSTQAASLLELVAFAAVLAYMTPPFGESFEQKAFVVGQHLRNVQNFFNVCSAWNAFLSSRTLLMTSTAATNRVKQLYVKLEGLEAPVAKPKPKRKHMPKLEPPETFTDEGELVSFKSVTIHTPSKQALLRDLSFCLSHSAPLLVCGQASSGKTALARCLFGLWPISNGQVSRPGGSERHIEGIPFPEDLLYVPETPLLGWASTLSDEVTFPRPMAAGLPHEELYKWLAYVGLEHLAKDTELTSLSLREKQALGFARILFHRPHFAILDECTSAMGPELERHFLRLLRELGIGYITIARRPSQSLKNEHSRLLMIQGARGEDTRGWKLSELSEVTMKPRCRCSAEAFQRLDSYLECRHSDSEEIEPATSSSTLSRSRPKARETVELRWRSAPARLWATLQLGLLTSGRRRTILQKAGLILLLLHARTKLYWRFCQNLSGSLQALLSRDLAAVAKQLLFGALVALGSGFADQVLRYQAKLATLELWSGAVSHLQRKLMRELTLLRVEEEVSEPMQRLAEIRSIFESLGSNGCEALLATAQLVFVAPFLVRSLGTWSFLFLGHFLVLRLLQRSELREDLQFQAQHKRLRAQAEASALCCRGIAEQQKLSEQFEMLMSTGMEMRGLDFLHQLAITALTDFRQVPSWVLRFLSLKFSSPFSETLEAAELLSETVLFDRMMQAAFIATQQLAKCAEKVGRLDSQCLRCLELVVAVEVASRKPLPLQISDHTAGDVFQFAKEGLVSEDGVRLARKLRFELAVNQPLLICGPKGFSKPLLQLLLGVDTERSSTRLPLETMVLVMQEPYVPAYCRLLAQLAYPLLLRLPSHGPFMVHVTVPEKISESQLRRHFAQLGAAHGQTVESGRDGKEVQKGFRKVLIHFSTFEETIKAVARPQDRIIDEIELQCEIAVEKTASPGEAVPQLGRMRECLHAVGLDHILTREADGWFARRSWPELLTREEQQRLGLARVLYHRPTFCILEEATCCLPATQEAELHKLLLRFNVTPLALASQPFLETLYRRQLHLGLAKGNGWKLIETAE